MFVDGVTNLLEIMSGRRDYPFSWCRLSFLASQGY